MVKYFNVVKSEIKFEIVLYFQNMVAVVTDLIVFSLIFLAFILLNSGMSLANTYNIDIQYSKVLLFMGYFVWTFSSRAMTCISAELNFEASNGYLFSKLTSILPIQFLYFAKFIGALFSQFVIMMPVILIAFIFWPTPPINITSILAIGFIVVVDLIGMYGIGLLLGSITIYDKRLSRIPVLLSTILLFTSNTITYNDKIGEVLKFFPMNFANDNVRKLVAGHHIVKSDLCIFAFLCFILFFAGIFIFNISKDKAREKGKILWY